MEEITTLGIDLAKRVFALHGVNALGRVVCRRLCQRDELVRVVAQLSPCLIGMEACSGAHEWARQFACLGHTVRLMAPKFVRPYRKTGKNDFNDAEAICEAVGRPNMRFIPVKSLEQQAVLSIHRVRQGFVEERTATINRIRGLLSEFGLVLPQKAIAVAVACRRCWIGCQRSPASHWPICMYTLRCSMNASVTTSDASCSWHVRTKRHAG
jgi:transposase